MIEQLNLTIAELPADPESCRLETHLADVRGFPMQDASFIVLNLTLQFISPAERTTVIRDVYSALVPGGAVLISEKIHFDDDRQQALLTELHHDFKRAHGYSDMEIAQKRTAIENRLIPESLHSHVNRLTDAGFQTVAPWFQCFNFASLLAVKADQTP